MRNDNLTTSILAWLALILVGFGFAWLVRRRNRKEALAERVASPTMSGATNGKPRYLKVKLGKLIDYKRFASPGAVLPASLSTYETAEVTLSVPRWLWGFLRYRGFIYGGVSIPLRYLIIFMRNGEITIPEFGWDVLPGVAVLAFLLAGFVEWGLPRFLRAFIPEEWKTRLYMTVLSYRTVRSSMAEALPVQTSPPAAPKP